MQPRSAPEAPAIALAAFESRVDAEENASKYRCQAFGSGAPEAMGDGLLISTDEYTCRINSGSLSAGVLTGRSIWNGAVRRPFCFGRRRRPERWRSLGGCADRGQGCGDDGSCIRSYVCAMPPLFPVFSAVVNGNRDRRRCSEAREVGQRFSPRPRRPLILRSIHDSSLSRRRAACSSRLTWLWRFRDGI
jgi:hypothetical protein